MRSAQVGTAVVLGLAASALIAGCSRKEPEQAAAPASTDAAAPAETASAAYPTRVFFGDTHLHTAMSMDAGAFGNRLGVEDAYRFARGEEVTASSGQKAKLSRPLDFLVVADHSDNMGFFPDLFAEKPELLADPTGKKWYDMIKAGEGNAAALDIIDKFSRGTFPKELMYFPGTPAYAAAWKLTRRRGREIQRARQVHRLHRLRVDLAGAARQQPAPGGDLSRRRRQGGPDRAVHDLSARRQHDAGRSVEGVAGLRGQDRRPGAGDRAQRQPVQRHDVPVGRQPGEQAAADRASTRKRASAGSRCTRRPRSRATARRTRSFRKNDEFAGFEIWDKGNLNLSELKKNEMLQGEYARTALQTGLQLEQKLGVNPYKFGMIGSTDSHTSLATADDNNFFGKNTPSEPGPKRVRASLHEDQARHDHGLGADRIRLRRGLGDGEHARRPLGCDEAQGNLRHHRAAHDRALLRRLGFRRGAMRRRATSPRPATARACRWAAT